MNCAYINNATRLIINIIVANPTDPISEGFTLIEIPSDMIVNIGYTYNGSSFIDIEGNIVLPTPPQEEIIEEVIVEEVING
jgi:hypothetical protein